MKEASKRITAVSTELIGCAHRVAEEGGGEMTDTQQLEDLQETLEDTELLRRDWASQVMFAHKTHSVHYNVLLLSPTPVCVSQVHLITAHIDALTAQVSAPLDRLVDIALQASRTSSMAKQHLLGKFENKAAFIRDQLEVVSPSLCVYIYIHNRLLTIKVESCFQDVTAAVEQREPSLDDVGMSISFLKKLTPHAVGACRSLTCTHLHWHI